MKLFQNKLFRKLFISRAFVILADSMLFLSILKWLEIETGSHFDTYYIWLMIISYLPALLFSYPVGVWAESHYFQKTMLFTNFSRIILLILLMIGISHFSPVIILFYLLIEGILFLFYGPSSQSLVIHLIEKDDLPQVNILFQASYIILQSAGMILAAFFISLNISVIWLVGSVVILISVSSLLLTQIRPLVKNETVEGEQYKETFKQGVVYLNGNSTIKRLFITMFLAWVVAGSIEFILLTYVNEVWEIGVENFAYISVSILLGTFVGAIAFQFLVKKMRVKSMLLAPLVIYPFTLMSLNWSEGIWTVLPMFFLSGITLGLFQIGFISYLQLIVPKHMFTRVISVHGMIIGLGPLPGMGIFLSLKPFLPVETIVSILALSLWLLAIGGIFYLPKIKTLPEEKLLLNKETKGEAD